MFDMFKQYFTPLNLHNLIKQGKKNLLNTTNTCPQRAHAQGAGLSPLFRLFFCLRFCACAPNMSV